MDEERERGKKGTRDEGMSSVFLQRRLFTFREFLSGPLPYFESAYFSTKVTAADDTFENESENPLNYSSAINSVRLYHESGKGLLRG